MRYETELRMVADTFQKFGIRSHFCDLDKPASKALLLGNPFAGEQWNNTPLCQLLPAVKESTVYFATYRYCSFLFFRLPDFPSRTIWVLGPYLSQPISPAQVLKIAEQHTGMQFRAELEHFYTSLSIFPSGSHLHLMLDSLFDRLWGVGNYTVESVTDRFQSSVWPEFQFTDEDSALLNASIMEDRYRMENSLIEAVRSGQTRTVESFLARIPPHAFQQRISDPLRNLKNYCVITNTLLRKAAEQGGVHPVYIDTISSGFAKKIENLPTVSAGNSLISEMAQSYCRLVRDHATKGYSPPIQKAVMLIEGNLAGNLSLATVAKELNVNSSYLSTLFKKETKQTFTYYVNQRRINRAKHLLRSTTMQVQTIAQHCGILDFHYFCRMFKNSVGQTPTEYRAGFSEN